MLSYRFLFWENGVSVGVLGKGKSFKGIKGVGLKECFLDFWFYGGVFKYCGCGGWVWVFYCEYLCFWWCCVFRCGVLFWVWEVSCFVDMWVGEKFVENCWSVWYFWNFGSCFGVVVCGRFCGLVVFSRSGVGVFVVFRMLCFCW